MATAQGYRDERVNPKVVLAAGWITMLFVFVYVDVLALLRADVLRSALDGKVEGLDLSVNQIFLAASLIYVLIPILMVVLSLLLAAAVNRVANVAVSFIYAVTVAVSCVGETWAYYLLGGVAEIVLLLFIARTALKWPHEPVPPRTPTAGTKQARDADGAQVGTHARTVGI